MGYAFIGCLVLFVATVPAGDLFWWRQWSLWERNDLGSPFDVSAVMLWLWTANLTSLFAVVLLFCQLRELENKLKDQHFELDEELARARCGVKDPSRIADTPIRWATEPVNWMYLPFGLGLSVALTCALTIYFLHPKADENLVFVIAVWTGCGYIGLMAVNDALACRAYNRIICLTPGRDNRRTGDFDELVDALSDYQRILKYVDIPILVSLSLITIHKRLLEPNTYYLGFVAGAVAMHIVLGNIISLAIAGSSTVSLDDLPGPGAAHDRKTVWKWAVAAAMIVATLFMAWNAHDRSMVRIRALRAPKAGPLVVARAKNLFDPLPVTLNFIPEPVAYQGMGPFDIYMVSSEQYVRDDLPGTILLATDVSADCDVVAAVPPITRLSDLREHRIARARGKENEIFLSDALASVGLSISDVHVEVVDDDAAAVMQLKEGCVEAAVSTRTAVRAAAGPLKLKMLLESPREVGLVVAKDSLASDPRRLKQLESAWMRAVDITRADVPNTFELIKGVLGQRYAAEAREMDFADGGKNYELLGARDMAQRTRLDLVLRRTAARMAAFPSLRGRPAPNKFVRSEISALFNPARP